MKEKKIYKILREYKENLEEKGYTVLYIGLFGSQNYNLDDGASDYDAKAIVLPSLTDIVRRKTISKVYQFDIGEVDVKDVITFNDIIRKGNPAYVEVIRTKYFIGDKRLKEIFLPYNINPKAALGMAYEKLAAIKKGLPKSSPLIEEIGHDPKQLHHIARLHDMFVETNNESLEHIVPIIEYHEDSREFMLDLKRHGLNHRGILDRNGAIREAETIIGVMESHIKNFEFEQADIENNLFNYVERAILLSFFESRLDGVATRKVRTFGAGIPRTDKAIFKALQDKDGQDIVYAVYSILEMM